MTIIIRTPQFERPPGDPAPAGPPEDWDALSRMSIIALKELGCRVWNDPREADDEFDGGTLLLFPGEWYPRIPADFPIVTINGCAERFVPGVTDDDIRFGCLAYGILVRGA